MDKKKKDKKEKKGKIHKDKKDKKDKNKSSTHVASEVIRAPTIPLVVPNYLRFPEVQLPQAVFTNREWEQAGNILAGDTVTTFEILSLIHTTLDAAIIGHVCDIVRKNKRFKELKLRTITIAQPEFEALCEALKVNTSVTSLLFESVGLSLGQFQALSKCLEVNQRVEKLHIKNDKFYPISAESIKDIFTNNNRIHTLNLTSASFQANAFEKISEMIKSAPNLTNLKFVDVELDEKKSLQLLDALKVNKTIKKLVLENALKAAGMMQLGELLDVNTTIEHFSILHKADISTEYYERLANGLKKNYSLKSLHCLIDSQKGYEALFEAISTKPNIRKLKLGLTLVTDHSLLVNFLRESRTLQELHYFTTKGLDDEVVTKIFDSVKVNRGLRNFIFTPINASLAFCFSLFDAIKVNDTLTHLSTQFVVSSVAIAQPNEDLFWTNMEEALEHNESLISIRMVRFNPPAKVTALLERNKQKQLQHIRRVRSIIRTIVLRADQFSMLLPLEIWAMILSAVEFPGVTIDFGKILIDQINAQ